MDHPTPSRISIASLPWGANYVNISHPGLFGEAPPYVLDGSVQENLDCLLAMIDQADMFAVISFRTGPGRAEFTFVLEDLGDGFDESYLNDFVWQDRAAQDGWVAMWRYTAERSHDSPIVVGYDLMVEPNANEVGSHALRDALDIWDPEAFRADYAGTLYDWNQLYPRIIAAVREVDPETPILIGGMGYSAVAWLPYLEPTAQMWDTRACTYPGRCDIDWDGEKEAFDRTWLEALFVTVDAFQSRYGSPVAANEYGLARWQPGAAAFIDDQMDLFEQQGMNYALWVWDAAWQPLVEESNAFNFRCGPDPGNHADVESELQDVIVEYWSRNVVRPSLLLVQP